MITLLLSEMFFTPQAQLDYHDRGSLHPYDIEKLLNEFLEDSEVAGFERLLVITGKGQIVRPIVKRLLAKHPLVKEFNYAGYFNGQDGAFEVWI